MMYIVLQKDCFRITYKEVDGKICRETRQYVRGGENVGNSYYGTWIFEEISRFVKEGFLIFKDNKDVCWDATLNPNGKWYEKDGYLIKK